MFAGIVEKKVRVIAAERDGALLRLRIQKPRSWKLSLGQSVSVDGVCSTVVRSRSSSFDVEYTPTTLKKTTAASFKRGRVLNLERALTYGKRIEGHSIEGHVDMRTPVREIRMSGASRIITIKPNAQFARSIALHGSIALNGVSLTVAHKHGPTISMALIPHTLKVTNLGTLEEGDEVNVEIAAALRYVHAAKRSSR